MADRALLVGIGERGINDCLAMQEFLQERFKEGSKIKVLTDERATNEAIQTEITKLVNTVKPGDNIMICFSGKGTQVKKDK